MTVQFLIWGNFIVTLCWYFLKISKISNSCNPGILQHLVTFYQKNLCQILYFLLVLVSKYCGKRRKGYFQFLDFWSILIATLLKSHFSMNFFPVNLLDIFRTPSLKNIYEGIPLINIIKIYCLFAYLIGLSQDKGQNVYKNEVFLKHKLVF